VPNLANTVVVGKAKGGFRPAVYRDAKGRYFKCQVLSGPSGGPFTIRILSREAAGMPIGQTTLAGIVLGSAKTQTNCVFASARIT
jgi:hypothetical protein